MAARVFIDGEVGTTGLQIRERLAERDDIALISLDEDRRKDAGARTDALATADVAILCLPDDAAREAVALAGGSGTRFVDASTAHRIDPDWVFGFPELVSGQEEAVAGAARVSNPGCYSSAAIALIRPLREAGLLDGDAALSIFGISGYTGGGKALVAEYQGGTSPGTFIYGTAQTHKHLPEIMSRGRLERTPIFVPSVGPFAQGMLVQVALHEAQYSGDMKGLQEALADHYRPGFVSVRRFGDNPARENPEAMNGTNRMELAVLGDARTGRVVLSAVLDNLGKGASGAAVQNLNLMLGLAGDAGL